MGYDGLFHELPRYPAKLHLVHGDEIVDASVDIQKLVRSGAVQSRHLGDDELRIHADADFAFVWSGSPMSMQPGRSHEQS